MLSALKPLHVKLMLIGAIILIIGLFAPWYYQSTSADAKYYEMNALGGSLTGFLEEKGISQQNPLFFDLLTAYFSIIFALLSISFTFASVKLTEKSQKKWTAVISLLAGIAAIANIFYVHLWLGWYYTDGLLSYSDINGSRGPLLGYFLTWIATAMLFASTYISAGLAQMFPERTEKPQTIEKPEDKQP